MKKEILSLDPKSFEKLTRDKKICLVSLSDNEAIKTYRWLKNYAYNLTSIGVDGVKSYASRKDSNFTFVSFYNIVVAGVEIQRIEFNVPTWYMQVKTAETSKNYHLNKNSELVTLCGKKLECLIDEQEINEASIVCKSCRDKYKELNKPTLF